MSSTFPINSLTSFPNFLLFQSSQSFTKTAIYALLIIQKPNYQIKSDLMGLHLMALVKLKLLASTSHTISFTPYVTCLIGPFVLKIFMNSRSLSQLYDDVSYASRLLLFQFTHIAFNLRQEDLGNRSRWERALRLFIERITRQSSPSDEASSLHDLAMITL